MEYFLRVLEDTILLLETLADFMGKNGKNDFNEVEKQKKLSQMNKILSPKIGVVYFSVVFSYFLGFFPFLFL
ncbi:MAG: hypothetical protein BME94_07475 [Methanobacteriales archaeon Met13]